MATFPGDMSIGWGFGLEPQESQPTDPLLAVSELEQRVNDLTEQLRSLTLVVNTLVVCNEKRVVKNMLIASIEK